MDATKSKLRWLKNDNNTVASQRYKIKTTSTNEGTVEYSLTIRNVTMQDFGCYGCHVNTSYGFNRSLVCLQLSHSSKGENYRGGEGATIFSLSDDPLCNAACTALCPQISLQKSCPTRLHPTPYHLSGRQQSRYS